jgi:hypothetical protein
MALAGKGKGALQFHDHARDSPQLALLSNVVEKPLPNADGPERMRARGTNADAEEFQDGKHVRFPFLLRPSLAIK